MRKHLLEAKGRRLLGLDSSYLEERPQKEISTFWGHYSPQVLMVVQNCCNKGGSGEDAPLSYLPKDNLSTRTDLLWIP